MITKNKHILELESCTVINNLFLDAKIVRATLRAVRILIKDKSTQNHLPLRCLRPSSLLDRLHHSNVGEL